jgi:hypothetical protein
MLKNICFLILISLSVSCKAQEKNEQQENIKLDVNFNIFGQTKDEKDILTIWEKFLNCMFGKSDIDEDANIWIKSGIFTNPFVFLRDIKDIKSRLDRAQITVISLFPISSDTFELKTMFTSTYKSGKKTQLEYIVRLYAVKTNNSFKFITSPQWYFENWQKKRIGSINYCYSPSHLFNVNLATQLDSFNHSMSKLFKQDLQTPLYFIAKNVNEAYQIVGYDFSPTQATYNQYGGVTYAEPTNKIIFAGNDKEYYPHEIVHLYTSQFWGKDGHYYHQWFDEGIATFFGGYLGLPLDYHLNNVNKYLDKNPNEIINDISELYLVPGGDYKTDYMYAIGGLICKLVYQKEGMDGLFDLLKSGKTNEDFYKTIEKHFGVKKENFGTFIRNELKKI